jgi:hypothetical protein
MAHRIAFFFIAGSPDRKLNGLASRSAEASFDATMIVIGAETLERYFAAHRSARGTRAARTQYQVWLAIARRPQWRHPEDVKKSRIRGPAF